jgi:hypothetical protein
MYFLDICAADVTKKTSAQLAADTRKAALAARLRQLDVPSHQFSYLLAFMEKASDTESKLTDDELQANIVRDVSHVRDFFVKASVAKGDDHLLGSLGELRRSSFELGRPAYLAFLRAVSDRCELHQAVSKPKRFDTASELIALADGLGIDRQHPVLTVTLACLYGNPSARKVLKFKRDPQAFKAEKALPDIMTIGRFLAQKLQLQEDYRKSLNSFRHVEYITDDAGLEEVLSCYEGDAFSSREVDGHAEERTRGRVEFAKLLTEISHEPGPLSDAADPPDAGPSEYDRICALLFS